MEAKIALAYKNNRQAEAVAKAVSPDNFEVPSGLIVKTTYRGAKVFTHIKCETTLPTFVSTIDDLLSCVSIAEKTFIVANDMEGSTS
jgi:hypothetical protein